MNKLALALNHVTFGYTLDKQIVNIEEWQVAPGESVFLQGASGSGKSTLLNLIAGVHVVNSGEILIDGENICAMSASERDAFRANQLGIVFQQFNLVPYLNVLDNVLLASYFAKNSAAEMKTRATELCASLGLSSTVMAQTAEQLSIGQQQRVAIARALLNKPKLLLVDEPTSALDADATDEFMSLLQQEQQKCGCALVFVSHDQRLAKHCDTSITLADINNGSIS